MRGNRVRLVIWSAILVGLAQPGMAQSYNVWCDNAPIISTNVSSVFAEARWATGTACGSGCYPARFHGGIDIADTPCKTPGTAINAIESGVIVSANPIKIKSTSGLHFFTYLHVTMSTTVAVGTSVVSGQKIGTVSSISNPHLHLNDISVVGDVAGRVNPQLPQRLIVLSTSV